MIFGGNSGRMSADLAKVNAAEGKSALLTSPN